MSMVNSAITSFSKNYEFMDINGVRVLPFLLPKSKAVRKSGFGKALEKTGEPSHERNRHRTKSLHERKQRG